MNINYNKAYEEINLFNATEHYADKYELLYNTETLLAMNSESANEMNNEVLLTFERPVHEFGALIYQLDPEVAQSLGVEETPYHVFYHDEDRIIISYFMADTAGEALSRLSKIMSEPFDFKNNAPISRGELGRFYYVV